MGNLNIPYGASYDGYQQFQNQMNQLNEHNRLGYNLNTGRLGIEGLSQLLAGLTSLGGLKQANDQFKFQKAITTKNMQNSVSSYNRELADTINARAAQNGNMSKSDISKYVELNKLSSL
jgi:hypothetical protein